MDLFTTPMQDESTSPVGSQTTFGGWLMKYAKQILALALTLLPALAAAQLHSEQRIVAQVPFEFMVANKPVPAGEYIVQPATMDGRTLVIRNMTARLGVFSQAWLDDRQKAAAYALVFHKYGNQYFLVGINLAGERITYRLPESKAEAELRAQNVPVAEKILVASLK
jgi:hypothetical protein